MILQGWWGWGGVEEDSKTGENKHFYTKRVNIVHMVALGWARSRFFPQLSRSWKQNKDSNSLQTVWYITLIQYVLVLLVF